MNRVFMQKFLAFIVAAFGLWSFAAIACEAQNSNTQENTQCVHVPKAVKISNTVFSPVSIDGRPMYLFIQKQGCNGLSMCTAEDIHYYTLFNGKDSLNHIPKNANYWISANPETSPLGTLSVYDMSNKKEISIDSARDGNAICENSCKAFCCAW